MSFATPMFLWAYLPLILVLTWLLPARLRNGIVAVAGRLGLVDDAFLEQLEQRLAAS
jgi:hypothetical protein